MPNDRPLPRRTFLLATAALAAACSRGRYQAAPLGLLAYVDKETLWLRDLPDGTPRPLAAGRRIARPKFSPAGRWIAFRDGDLAWIVSTDGKFRKQWKAGSSYWIPGRDELAISLSEGRADEPKVFTPADNWSVPQRSITGSDVTINDARAQYAWTLRMAAGRYSDQVEKFKTTLLLSKLDGAAQPKPLDETEGFFVIAGFTRSGDWLLYWRSPEMSASIQADGLDLYAASTSAGEHRKLGVETLVYQDMVSISPTKEVIAVTSGGGRETWANKSIALIDLAARGEPAVSYLADPAASAQLPAWSPDGEKLAWCAGPDANALGKRQLLERGQKTIRVIDPNGTPKEIPITPALNLGASEDVVEQCVRLRRIWVAEIGPRGRSRQLTPRQLTSDARYFDEEPRWSHEGSHILFCRVDAHDARTIWVMRNDGSEIRQAAGPLAPPRGLSELEMLSYYGYYGHTEWSSLFDWWRGP